MDIADILFPGAAWLAAAAAVPALAAAAGAAAGLGARDAAHCGFRILAGTAGFALAGFLLRAALGFAPPEPAARAGTAALAAIPACVALNLLLFAVRATRTISIDAPGMLKFSFLAAAAAGAGGTGCGVFAALACFAFSLAAADFLSQRLAKTYPAAAGLSVPDPFCLTAIPFAIAADKAARRLAPPGNSSAGDEEKKTSALAAAFLAFAAGCAAGCFVPGARAVPARVLFSGMALAAVTMITPAAASALAEPYSRIAGAVRSALAARCGNPGALFLGVGPEFLAGHRANVLCAVTLSAAAAVAGRLCGGLSVDPAAVFFVSVFAVPFARSKVVPAAAASVAAFLLCLWLAPAPAPAPAQGPADGAVPAAGAAQAAGSAESPQNVQGSALADAANALADAAEADAEADAARTELDSRMDRYLSARRAVSGPGEENFRAQVLADAADRLVAASRAQAAAMLRQAAAKAEAAVRAAQEKAAVESPAPSAPAAPEDAGRPADVRNGLRTAPPDVFAAASLPGWAAKHLAASLGWTGIAVAVIVLFVFLYANRCEITGEARLLRRRPKRPRGEQKELF